MTRSPAAALRWHPPGARAQFSAICSAGTRDYSPMSHHAQKYCAPGHLLFPESECQHSLFFRKVNVIHSMTSFGAFGAVCASLTSSRPTQVAVGASLDKERNLSNGPGQLHLTNDDQCLLRFWSYYVPGNLRLKWLCHPGPLVSKRSLSPRQWADILQNWKEVRACRFGVFLRWLCCISHQYHGPGTVRPPVSSLTWNQ